MITEEQKEQLTTLIAKMDAERHYWFFRTMGGYYFDEFVNDGFIAIGYDEILMKELKALPERDDEARAQLKIHLDSQGRELTPAQTAKAAGQILKFYREMQHGDIVVIPGFLSQKFAFGVVQGNLYEDVRDYHEEGKCPFAKRRTIKWLKMVDRAQLDPKFLLGLSNQQTMSCVDAYAEFIDRKMEKLYSKGDKTYLVLRVNQDKGLAWDDFCFIADLGELFKNVSNELGLEVDLTKIDMKVNVQSPGDILLICPENLSYLLPIAKIALFSIILIGGKVKFIESKGIGSLIKDIESAVTHFLDSRQERKIRMMERMQNMQLEDLAMNEKNEPDTKVSPEALLSSEDGSAQKEPPKQ